MQNEKGNYPLLVATAGYTLKRDSRLVAQSECLAICLTRKSGTAAVRRGWGQFCLESAVVCEEVVA